MFHVYVCVCLLSFKWAQRSTNRFRNHWRRSSMGTTFSEPRIRMYDLTKHVWPRASQIRRLVVGLPQKIWERVKKLGLKKKTKSRVWGWEKEKRPGRNSPLQPLEAALVFLISSSMQPTGFTSQGISDWTQKSQHRKELWTKGKATDTELSVPQSRGPLHEEKISFEDKTVFWKSGGEVS